MGAGANLSHVEPLWQHEGMTCRDCIVPLMPATAGPLGSSCTHEGPQSWACGCRLLAPPSATASPLGSVCLCRGSSPVLGVAASCGVSRTAVPVAVSACTRKGLALCRAWLLAQPVEADFALWCLTAGHCLCCPSGAGAPEACDLACRLRAASPGRFPDPGPVETTPSWQVSLRAACQRSSSSCW